MKNGNLFLCCLFLGLCLSLNIFGQTTVTYYNQTFKIDTLYPASGSTGMNSPWEVVYGPDDSLWVALNPMPTIYGRSHLGNKGKAAFAGS